jgi:regulatory protein YycI of two-component signal transduction system YycFG
MKTRIITLIILIILLSIFISHYFLDQKLTGYGIKIEQSSFTMAVCNKTNTNKSICEDYEIICKGDKIQKITPTGFAVQYSEDWEDPRGKNGSKIVCR